MSLVKSEGIKETTTDETIIFRDLFSFSFSFSPSPFLLPDSPLGEAHFALFKNLMKAKQRTRRERSALNGSRRTRRRGTER